MGLTVQMTLVYRRYIRWKVVLPPALASLVIACAVIYLSTSIDGVLAKRIFGVFLIILCIYYLFVRKAASLGVPISRPAAVSCVVVSAICDGLFGVGGPLMVVFFMSVCGEYEEYLGCFQAYFLVTQIVYAVFRAANGLLTIEAAPLIGMGLVSIVIAAFLARGLVRVLDHNLIERLVYVMLGIAGVLVLI